MQIDYSIDALAEVESVINFYLAASPQLGVRFQDDLRHAELLLISNARGGSRIANGCRRLLLRHFPYGFIYQLNANHRLIKVTALAHHSRRPAYWSYRVEDEPAVYQLAA